MNEQTHTTEEIISNQTTQQEIDPNINAEQITPEASGSTPGQTQHEQVDFAQMYDMLTERDKKITELTSEIVGLKKTNTELLLKVNASASAGSTIKDPFQNFVDAMVAR